MSNTQKQQKADHIRRLIVGIVTRSGHDVKVSLPSLLREAIRDQLWKQLRRADGSRYTNAVDWLEDGLPNGCLVGVDRAYFSKEELAQIIADLGDSKATRTILKTLQSSSNRNNGKAEVASPANQLPSQKGNKPTLEHVLQRDYPAYWQGYLNGEYGSVYATAVAAGIKKDGHNPLQRMKAYWRRASPKQQESFRKWIRGESQRRQ
jgi:hypothetical protein